eukprot:gene5797-6037_t
MLPTGYAGLGASGGVAYLAVTSHITAYMNVFEQAANKDVVWANIRGITLVRRNREMFPKQKYLLQWDEEEGQAVHVEELDPVYRDGYWWDPEKGTDYVDLYDAYDPDLVPLDAPDEWLMPAEGMDLALDAEVDAVTATVLETVWSTSVVIPVVGEIVTVGMLLASTFLLIWDAVQRNKE